VTISSDTLKARPLNSKRPIKKGKKTVDWAKSRDKNNKNDAYSTMKGHPPHMLKHKCTHPRRKAPCKDRRCTVSSNINSQKKGGRVSKSQRQTKLHA
jgi:hypothetical protein